MSLRKSALSPEDEDRGSLGMVVVEAVMIRLLLAGSVDIGACLLLVAVTNSVTVCVYLGDVIDIAETDEELELKEKIYITRLDDISHTLDGLIVEDKIISLNTIDSMLKHMKCEGVTITSLKVDKIDILLKKMKVKEVLN